MSEVSDVRMQISDLRVALTESGLEILKGVSLKLHAGKIFALVGESGSGKSVTSMAAMRLLPEALQITGGAVQVGDQDLFDLSESAMQTVRGRRVAMIFQRHDSTQSGTDGWAAGSRNPALTHSITPRRLAQARCAAV